jgi:hypothetical protein
MICCRGRPDAAFRYLDCFWERTRRTTDVFALRFASMNAPPYTFIVVEMLASYLHRHSALSRASSRQTDGNELERAATLFPSQVLPIYPCHVRFPALRAAPQIYKPVAVRSDSRSTLHGHAAAYD